MQESTPLLVCAPESESEESSADEAGPAARARPAVAAVKREVGRIMLSGLCIVC
jgi:hypothetical protein